MTNALARFCGNKRPDSRILWVMPQEKSAKLSRSLRLKTEARNCLTIAIQQRDTAFAGELIDEAVRLARRARELNEESQPPRRTKFR